MDFSLCAATMRLLEHRSMSVQGSRRQMSSFCLWFAIAIALADGLGFLRDKRRIMKSPSDAPRAFVNVGSFGLLARRGTSGFVNPVRRRKNDLSFITTMVAPSLIDNAQAGEIPTRNRH